MDKINALNQTVNIETDKINNKQTNKQNKKHLIGPICESYIETNTHEHAHTYTDMIMSKT